jgi:hypothetical protein
METETIALSEVRAPERNVRSHPERQIAELARSVEMFGQTRPIVIDENNTVLVGNGLVAALRLLQRDNVDSLRISGLSASQKHKLMLSDNKIFTLGFDDYAAMMSMFRELEDLDVPGFDEDLLRSMTTSTDIVTRESLNKFGLLNDAEVDAAIERSIPQGSIEPDYSAQDDELVCPHCGKRLTP